MIKAHGKVRSVRTRSLGVECLEGRVVLSGATHAYAAASPAAVAAEQAALPPTLEESYLLENGDLVTGLVMVFSKPLNPATAQDVNNYQVERMIASSPAEFTDGFPTETLSAAVCNASQDSVTLMLAQPFTLPQTLSPGQTYAFTVFVPSQGSAITDTSGQQLILGLDGIPGSILLCNVPVNGTAPNPLVNTYSQARLNAAVSKLAMARSIATTNASSPIHLAGTIHGTYFPYQTWLGTDVAIKGAGSISPIGHVTESTVIGPVIDPKSQDGSLQTQGRLFRNTLGTFNVAFDNLQQTSSKSLVGDYTITGPTIAGGTGAYAGETGSGHVQVTWTGNRSRGKVTEIYS